MGISKRPNAHFLDLELADFVRGHGLECLPSGIMLVTIALLGLRTTDGFSLRE